MSDVTRAERRYGRTPAWVRRITRCPLGYVTVKRAGCWVSRRTEHPMVLPLSSPTAYYRSWPDRVAYSLEEEVYIAREDGSPDIDQERSAGSV